MPDCRRSEPFFHPGFFIAVSLGLYLSSLYSYLLFHSLVEIITIAVGFALFMLAWNTHEYQASSYLRLLGIGYAAIAMIDLVHTLAFKGMNVFPGYGLNLPAELWIAARYLQAITLFAAPFLMERDLDNRVIFGVYIAVVPVLLGVIFYGHFPTCYIEGKGLTPFKIISEYVISALLVASLYLLSLKRRHLDEKVFFLTAASIACTILSELSFTVFVDMYGMANMVGHLGKLAAFYLIYRAILVTGLKNPFDLIFRDLKQAEEALQKSQESLEEKVRERTVELRDSETRYRSLIHKVRTAIVLHDGQGRILDSNPLAQELLGLSADQLVGRQVTDPEWHFQGVDGSALPLAGYPVSQVLSTRQPLRGYVMGIIRPDGGDVAWMLVNAEPEYGNDGEITQVIVSFVDMTELKRAEDALHEKGRHSQALLRLSRNLERAQTHGEVLELARDEAQNITGYQNLWVYLLTEDKKYLKALVAGGPISDTVMSEEGTATLTIQGDRMLEEIAQANEIVIVEDARTDDRVNKEITTRLDMRTIVNIPIFLSDRRLGAVGVGTFGDEGLRVPTKPEQEFLLALASHLAVALDRIQLLNQRRKNEEALHRLNRELRAISDCNQTLMRAEDEQTLLDNICHIICDEAGYRMAWVGYAENDEAQTVRPVASAGFDSGYIASAQLSWADDTERGRGPGGKAIRNGETVYVQELEADPCMAAWRESALRHGYRSTIGLPLKDERGSAFGALLIYSAEINPITPDELRLLEELAGDLAFGIMVLRARVERDQAEATLREREAMYRSLVTAMAEGVVFQSASGDIIAVNPAAEKIEGRTAKEMVGKHSNDPLWGAVREDGSPFPGELHPAMVTLRTGEPQTDVVMGIHRPDGRLVWISVNSQPLIADGGTWPYAVVTTFHDISEHKRLEAAEHESEQKFRSLAENSSDNIIRYDRQCRAIYVNHQVKTTLRGTEDSFLGKTPLEKFPEGLYAEGVAEMENYQATLKRVISSGDLADVELHIPDSSGALRIHSIRFTAERNREGCIVGALAFGRDITEKAKLEEQLRQSQKMEAIGQLAGGVAHDFNNILTAIIGFSNLAKMKMKPDDPQRPLIDHILASSDRAAHLTQSLLAFSRKQVIIPKPVDLNAIVKSVEKLLWRLIGEDIEFTTHLALQSLIVMADAGQIEQVLMNLATNARDAMPRGGELALSTEVRVIREDFTDAHGYGRPGSYAMITVSDTGTGMDEATRGKIFEPFFTTKEQGKGTGLGLSMVYGIIKQHDGNITVFSEPEKGTTFRILLPLIAMEVEEAHSEMDMPPPGGTETLLFAEDDLDVRSLTTTILRDFGYRVIVALDGRDALEKYNEYSDEIDLLILDVIMPKMSGKETYDAVRAIRPDSKFLFISGYTADALHKKGVFEEGAHFVAKPMSPFELLTKVRAVLDGTP